MKPSSNSPGASSAKSFLTRSESTDSATFPSRRFLSQKQSWLLLAGDGALILLSLHASALLRFGEFHPMLAEYTGASLVFFFAFLVAFYVLELYEPEALSSGSQILVRLCFAAALAVGLLSVFFFWSLNYRYGRGIFLLAALLLIPMAYAWRRFHENLLPPADTTVPTLLVGDGPILSQIRSRLEANPSPYHVIREFHSIPSSVQPDGKGTLTLPGIQELEQLIAVENVKCLVLSSDTAALIPAQTELLTRLKFNGVRVMEAGQFCSQLSGMLPLDLLSDSWLLFADGFELVHARMARRIKRVSDILLASAGLLVSLPISLLTAIAIALDSPGPILYRQKRVGLMEHPFELLKFRSMHVDAEKEGEAKWAKPNDSRATRVGRVIRKLRIDEIPQMINILRGEMSFIGPRPERPEFVQQLQSAIPFFHLRHYVRPGLTGWAQVNYPYGASPEDARRKLEYDLYYIMHATPLLDLKILLRTVRVVLLAQGSR